MSEMEPHINTSIMTIHEVAVDAVTPYENNPRKIPQEAIDRVAASIKEFGFKQPIVVDKDMVIIVGHTRLLAAKKLGYETVPVLVASDLSPEKARAYRLADNKTNEFTDWNFETLQEELASFLSIEDFNMEDFGFDMSFLDKKADDVLEDDFDVDKEIEDIGEPTVKRGQVYRLGDHYLMCGDATSKDDIKKLITAKEGKVDLVFTDPPYGMKKEKDGVANDNLNYDDLLKFNKQWIPITFDALKENGSWYCWGIDEPLMDIYSEILKPMIRENKITFRNLITWDKGNGQGQLNSEFRMYPIADEKCLFVVRGIQCLTLNADKYWEKYEPIRKYLYDSRIAMGWDVPTMKKIVGHSDLFRDHWTSKSQFSMPTREVYEKLKSEAEKTKKEKGIENDAFCREYDDLRREYDDLRAYFDNTHDNMNNVWHFSRTSNEEKELAGGHATPKPIALCSRAIKSSSREGDTVLDVFGGSGSTLIACEQLNRKAYLMELDPKWCDVIIKRWESLTGKTAKKIC